MYVTLVHVHVKPNNVDDFIEVTKRNHEASIREQGNRRFDVLQSADDPTRFVLYEAFASAEDAVAHKETDHYRAWREAVSDHMAQPRHGDGYFGLFPK